MVPEKCRKMEVYGPLLTKIKQYIFYKRFLTLSMHWLPFPHSHQQKMASAYILDQYTYGTNG